MAHEAWRFPRMFGRMWLSPGAARLITMSGAAWLVACAGTHLPTPAPRLVVERKASVAARSTDATTGGLLDPRLFPPLDGSETLAAGEERDGSRRWVAYGLRVLARPTGALELSREYLPAARTVQSLELPRRLGGGFLFYVLSSNTTLFFRAPTFTAEVEPFARLDFEAEQVVPGFDRLYVVGRAQNRLTALDIETGKAIGLGSLPPSPMFGKMAFVDGWFGAVQTPLRGIVVTFDAGTSWRPLDFAATNVEATESELLLTGPDSVVALNRSGVFSRRDASAEPQDAENPVAQRLRQSLSGGDVLHASRAFLTERALKLAVLNGFRESDGHLVVANSGSLLRVQVSDGKVVQSDDHAYLGTGECTALPLGDGFGFACGNGAEATSLFSFEPPFRMRLLRTFAGARYVASSGNGALVIRGGCDARTEPSAGAYCIAEKSGNFREIRVRGDLGVERVVALRDGRVAVIVPPRLGASGFVSLIDEQGGERRRPLLLPRDDAHGEVLLENGLWLDGFQEQANGALSGWVAGADPFVGVRVTLDGAVSASRPQNSIDRALLSGLHGLIVGRSGRALETSDGGFEWSEVELPAEFDAAKEPRDEARLQGCSAIGCAFAGFVRVGWKNGATVPRLPIASLPVPTPALDPGGGRWVLRCEPTGETSEPQVPLAARVHGGVRSEDGLVPPWAPFLELNAPTLTSSEVGFDTARGEGADSVELHAYAWGERAADWARTGHTLIRALDRFQVTHGAFQTAVSRSPWADANAAAEAFGFDGTGNSTLWRALLEPGQRSGAVVVSSRGLLDLLLFEEGRSVTRLANVARYGFGMLTGVTKLGDAWYVAAFDENHSFTLSRITGSRIERVAEYPNIDRQANGEALVRGVHGDALGIWVMAAGWYLFPIDLETFAVQTPLYASAADLAKMPPVCAPDADGFLLSNPLSLPPNLRFSRDFERMNARVVSAQFIWSARGLCTRALAAESESVPRHVTSGADAKLGASDDKVPLVVTERRPLGRRWGFRCSP